MKKIKALKHNKTKQKHWKMPKLYFKYGCMSSSKTANLLMTAFKYKQQNKKVWVIKSSIDDRYEDEGKADYIVSRTGLELKADLLIDEKTKNLEILLPENCNCVLVDECQFLQEDRIDELRKISKHCPVICYGLRTDFRLKLFTGSKRLMELADSIEEIKSLCVWCDKKAVVNFKYRDNKIIKNGGDGGYQKVIEVGSDDLYSSSCWRCWEKNTVYYPVVVV